MSLLSSVSGLFPGAVDGVLENIELLAIPELYLLEVPVRLACFLAQTAHETGGYRWLRELGDSRYFARYDGRMGNRRGEGAKYKGRGLIHVTGRNNYVECGQALNISLLDSPELLELPEYAVQSAIWYWRTHHLNRYADSSDFVGLTRKINGGLNGLEDRKKRLRQIADRLDIEL